MPHRPDFSQHRPDQRFDSYRQRVGRLHRGETEVGFLLIEVKPYYEQVGGHLWWRRWGPVHDVLWESTLVDGKHSDSLVPDDTSTDVLRAYGAGCFDYYGEALRVVWTDREASRRLRESHFGR
ncbi:hypothetical protein [uncultured Pseudokineococcus sp.]|uniref:hypothetical protein n=1 Tax=uncultured Pseudokineococcus sp. TaxID=1642928 RepID=UPI00263583FA|nr:hypothetical protein [uncultured Pseudokineococcus sp.]